MNISQIKEALAYGSKSGNVRSNLFKEARNLEKWDEVRTSEFYSGMLDELDTQAKKFLNTPIEALPYSLYKVFDKTGSRLEYERPYFQRRARLDTFATLSIIYNKSEHIKALEDIIWAICDEYTWCLPAHFWGNCSKVPGGTEKVILDDGLVRKYEREHNKQVDLFSAETGFALAEIVSLLEDRLQPLVVRRVRNEITQRILSQLCEMNSFFH